jgi:hypothetical protein
VVQRWWVTDGYYPVRTLARPVDRAEADDQWRVPQRHLRPVDGGLIGPPAVVSDRKLAQSRAQLARVFWSAAGWPREPAHNHRTRLTG